MANNMPPQTRGELGKEIDRLFKVLDIEIELTYYESQRNQLPLRERLLDLFDQYYPAR